MTELARDASVEVLFDDRPVASVPNCSVYAIEILDPEDPGVPEWFDMTEGGFVTGVIPSAVIDQIQSHIGNVMLRVPSLGVAGQLLYANVDQVTVLNVVAWYRT